MLKYNFTGSAATVEKQLELFIAQTAVDELMVISNIYDHHARVRSYEILSRLNKEKKIKKRF